MEFNNIKVTRKNNKEFTDNSKCYFEQKPIDELPQFPTYEIKPYEYDWTPPKKSEYEEIFDEYERNRNRAKNHNQFGFEFENIKIHSHKLIPKENETWFIKLPDATLITKVFVEEVTNKTVKISIIDEEHFNIGKSSMRYKISDLEFIELVKEEKAS